MYSSGLTSWRRIPALQHIPAFSEKYIMIIISEIMHLIVIQMILIANPAKPFKVTPKQTLKRADILKEYSHEISEAYRAFELSSSSMDIISPPSSWNESNCVGFVHSAVTRIIGHDLHDNDDFFQNGMNRYEYSLILASVVLTSLTHNSLGVVYLRSTIARALQRSGIKVTFEASFVYDYPTAASLGKLISETVTGNRTITETPDRRARQLASLLERYTAHFPQHFGTLPMPEKETVLVTGTTGSLGINVLKTLVSLESVQRVYAFNRKGPTGSNPRDRHTSAARLQGIDDSLLDSPKIVYLEGHISLANIGLPENVVQELRRDLTSVLHLGEHCHPVFLFTGLAYIISSVESRLQYVREVVHSPVARCAQSH